MSNTGQSGTMNLKGPRRIFPSRPSAVLIGLGLIAAFLFTVTSLVAGAYHRMQTRMARDWFLRGQLQMQSGRPKDAIQDFRNALAYSRSRDYLLRLAESLAETGNYEEARGYLLSLWEEQPGSGLLNLQLARLSARTGSVSEAVRYYQNAIYGVWTTDPTQRRREVRLELARFLLAHDNKSDAESDLISLAADLPNDPNLYTEVGELFSRADAPERALAQFEKAAKLNPAFEPALSGAGVAAFNIGNYSLAKRYLERAIRANPSDARAQQTLNTTTLVLNMDPLQRRINMAERSKRLQAAWQQAVDRLQVCAQQKGAALPEPATSSGSVKKAGQKAAPESIPQPSAAPAPADLEKAYADLMSSKTSLSVRALRNDPDIIDNVMAQVFSAETVANKYCGSPSGPDLALTLIARLHGVTAQ